MSTVGIAQDSAKACCSVDLAMAIVMTVCETCSSAGGVRW